jgi:hypothetical protein
MKSVQKEEGSRLHGIFAQRFLGDDFSDIDTKRSSIHNHSLFNNNLLTPFQSSVQKMKDS